MVDVILQRQGGQEYVCKMITSCQGSLFSDFALFLASNLASSQAGIIEPFLSENSICTDLELIEATDKTS